MEVIYDEYMWGYLDESDQLQLLPHIDTFESGVRYVLGVTGKPEEGYGYSDNLKVYYKDTEVQPYSSLNDPASGYVIMNDADNSLTVYILFEPVESIAVSEITAPLIGVEPSTEGISLGSCMNDADGLWAVLDESGEMQPMSTDTFRAGVQYMLCAAADLKAGYYYDDELKVYYNGAELPKRTSLDDPASGYNINTANNRLYVFIIFEPLTAIGRIDISGVTDPVIGAEPSTDSISLGNYMETPFTFYMHVSEDGFPLPMSTDTFEEGVKYTLCISTNAKEGYSLSEDTEVYYNGKQLPIFDMEDDPVPAYLIFPDGYDEENETEISQLIIYIPYEALQAADYGFIEGQNSSWTQNSDGTLTFRADGDFEKFTGVRIDGKLIEESSYTAVSGSTIITLKTDYLKTLCAGSHTLTAVYIDGECSTEFTIKAASTTPPTGDTSETALWFTLLAIGLIGITGTSVYRRKRA